MSEQAGYKPGQGVKESYSGTWTIKVDGQEVELPWDLCDQDEKLIEALVEYFPGARGATIKRDTKNNTITVIKKAGTKGADAPRCPECNRKLIYHDDRDDNGNIEQAWWDCDQCDYTAPYREVE